MWRSTQGNGNKLMRITALRGLEAAKRRTPSAGDRAEVWPWGGSADRGRRSGLNAFTLLEVIVACAIFFMVAFAVLGLVTRSLAAARSLQLRHPDAGMLAAVLTLTNKLEEGTASGDFEEFYPGLYPGCTWTREVYEAASNGLFQVDFTIDQSSEKKGASETKMSILMFRPGSPSRLSPGGGRR